MDKKLKYFSLTLVIGVVALLTACGGGGSTDATPVVPPVTTYMEFAYVGNAGDNNVSQYLIDSTTGALSQNTPAQVDTLETQNGIAATPDGEFVYITRPGTTDEVSQYSINDDGTLTWVADTATGDDPWGVVVDPSGLYAYVANSTANTISQFTITSGTGLLVANTPTTAPIPTGAPVQPTVMVIDPSGSHLYVAYFVTDVLVHYSIQTGGTLQYESTITSNIAEPIASPTSMAITPDGAYLYLANQAASGVSIYSIDANGNLAGVGKQNTGAGTVPDSEPASVVIDPTGTYLYVANNLEETVTTFSIDTGGTLTQIGTETSAVGAFAATINPSGGYLYVTDDFNDQVRQFSIGTNGELTAFGTPVSAVSLPWAITSVGITR